MIRDQEALHQRWYEAQKALQAEDCRVLVCSGTGCIATGSENAFAKFQEICTDSSCVTLEFAPHDNKAHVGIKHTGCQSICEMDPLVRIQKGKDVVQYTKVQPEDNDDPCDNKWPGS